jgi:shikimate kinase
MTEQTAEIILTPAERFYQNHIKRVCAYQKANPEKMREKCKKWNAKVKEENPDKYKDILEKKRKYYNEVRKPKLDAIKAEKKKAIEEVAEYNNSFDACSATPVAVC